MAFTLVSNALLCKMGRDSTHSPIEFGMQHYSAPHNLTLRDSLKGEKEWGGHKKRKGKERKKKERKGKRKTAKAPSKTSLCHTWVGVPLTP